MAAAVTLMAHEMGGANIVYQQLLWPALSAELDTESCRAYGQDRFLPKASMEYGWHRYAPDPAFGSIATPPRCARPPSTCVACRRRSS